jgi:tetratricopeptide (TPR) repeat protein
VIATTARKTRNAQDTVVALNTRSNKNFTVVLHFWEDICELLEQFPPVVAHLIAMGRDAASDLVASITQDPDVRSLTSHILAVGAEEITAGAFSEIEQLLVDRNFDAAAHEIDKLPSDANLAETPIEDQYMILRLRAKLAMETGQFERASELFLAAYEKQPDLDQAKQNQVLAYSLIPDSDKVFELASQYVASGLATPVMLCRLIESALTLEQINEHIALIKPHLATEEDINISLCHKLLQLGDPTGAAEAGERAVQIAADSPHAHFAAALPHHNASLKGDWQHRKSHLESALNHYDVAIKEAQEKKYNNLLPEIFVNRAAAHMLLGDVAAASADYRAAVATANKPAVYADNAVSYLVHRQEYAAAWELLEFLDDNTAEGRFLRIMTEFNTTEDEEERRQYLDEMLQLAEEAWDRSVECRLHCVNWALLLKDPPLAQSCITDAFQNDSPFQAHTALAWIAVESDERETALEHADKALEQDVTGVHAQEVGLLANLLTKLEQHDKALDLLEQIATPGLLNDETKLLITCAQQLERHDLLLRVCREVRQTGEQDDRLRRMEMELLNRYAPEQGFALADEFIQVSPAPAYFVAFKNMLAVRLDQLDAMQLDTARQPGPADLHPKESRLVILPYVTTGKYDEALQFLYEQLRIYFDDEHAHGLFDCFFFMYGDKTSLRQPPDKVEPHCAVLLEAEGGSQRWVVIEDNNPVPSRGEFAENSALTQRLIGREVGDVVELPGSLVQIEKATIREIQTKYVRAFQDSLQRFRERFPETSFIQPIHVGSGDDFDPTPIIESLKQRREYVEKCVEFYRTNPCSLHLFATRVGINELDAVKALAHHASGIVRCCHTTPREFDQAVKECILGEVIVLDISAIVTLTLLEGWDYLGADKTYLVSQATKELVDQWLSDASEERATEGGYASVDEHGQLLFEETTDEQRDARRAELNTIKEMIETHCECRSSEAVAALPPERRDAYEKFAGFHNVESMSLVKDVGGALWTDDLVLSLIAETDFGVPTVWTQLGLRCFVDAGHLTIVDFALVSAKLASWSYTAIIWKAETIIQSGEHAEWDPQRWPLKQCIKLIAKARLDLPARARIALACLKLLRQSSCIELKQSPVIQAILDAIRDRQAVAWMYNRLDQVFMIDFQSADFLRLELEYWLNSHLE